VVKTYIIILTINQKVIMYFTKLNGTEKLKAIICFIVVLLSAKVYIMRGVDVYVKYACTFSLVSRWLGAELHITHLKYSADIFKQHIQMITYTSTHLTLTHLVLTCVVLHTLCTLR